MKMPRYIVHRVDVDGLTITLTDVTDSVIVSEIDNAPGVVPKEKTGEWVTEEIDSYFGKKIKLTCSECGDVFSVTESEYPNERYCRYCGAKMKG